METAKERSAYKLAYANGYRLYFDEAGLLIEEEDLYSNRITYDYDGRRNLVKMTGQCRKNDRPYIYAKYCYDNVWR